ncbi:MAG: PqqD family protein [Synergistaceae bacterium]|nr:PqqD family protein [Synergistaceae bacterium]
MHSVYELLKGYIPVKVARKIRSEGDMIIASNHSGHIYYLNETAAYIWCIIDGTLSIESLERKIFAEYKATPEKIRNDLVNFIRDMQWKKLIRLKEVR